MCFTSPSSCSNLPVTSSPNQLKNQIVTNASQINRKSHPETSQIHNISLKDLASKFTAYFFVVHQNENKGLLVFITDSKKNPEKISC